MQEYDTTLKLLLRGQARVAMRELTGTAIENWLDAELPKVQNLRVDLLGESADRTLFHMELQSTNDAAMPLRMAEYCLGIFRLLGRLPRQLVLYVGEAPLRMERELRGPDVWFRYGAIDIRSLDGDSLLESPEVGDNVIAILARLRDHGDAVRRIVEKIAGLPPASRETALEQLLILAGLRRLEEAVEQEARRMPILDSILDNKVLGREFKRGRDQGRQEGRDQGRQEGRDEGRHEGELIILRRQIEKRFGALPAWAEEQLAGKSLPELEQLGVRLLDAGSLEDLLKHTR
jgi:Domain of unknown function (DUF4351)